jgi:hypothetical protein
MQQGHIRSNIGSSKNHDAATLPAIVSVSSRHKCISLQFHMEDGFVKKRFVYTHDRWPYFHQLEEGRQFSSVTGITLNVQMQDVKRQIMQVAT